MDVQKYTSITMPSDLHPTTEQLEQIIDAIVTGHFHHSLLRIYTGFESLTTWFPTVWPTG